jgi:hypothetical protein
MKRKWIFATALFLAVLPFHAYGAPSILYSPTQAEMTVPAGSQGTVSLRISLSADAQFGIYQLLFFDRLAENNLPSSWISVVPARTMLDRRQPSATTLLTIRVPEGTPPGIYSGRLFSKAMTTHEVADPGTGLLLSVRVEAQCSLVPGFEITAFGPSSLWPPNHRMEQATISGHLILPEGCTLLKLGYRIEDEYGVYTGTGEMTLGTDNTFAVSIPVEAWREGNDKDGRHYSITLYAEDEAGTGTSPGLVVLVPHDQRNP